MAKHESAASISSEGADVHSTNGSGADNRVVSVSPNVSQACKRQTASPGSCKRKDSTRPIASRTEGPIRMIFKAYVAREGQKFQQQPQVFTRHYGRIKSYEAALTSITTPNPKALANMAVAIGDCSAMLVLKQAIESVRAPPTSHSFHVGQAMSPEQRLDTIHRLDLRMAHLRLARWLHIYKLYEELSHDVGGGKNVDGFVVLTDGDLGQSSSGPLGSAQRGNPRNLEQASITRRMMDVVGADNSGSGDRGKTKSSMKRLRRVAQRLHLLVHQWGLGVLSLLGAGFTDDL